MQNCIQNPLPSLPLQGSQSSVIDSPISSHSFIHSKSTRQQTLHKRPLRFRVVVVVVPFLEQHGEDLDGGVEAQILGPLPSLYARDAYAWLLFLSAGEVMMVRFDQFD